MHLMNYYMDLRTSFDHEIESKPIRVTLDELASKLYCTTRNVKLLLKRMIEQGWIIWEPGRGRGNVSELTFLISSEEIISKEAMLLAQKGDFQGAVGLIHQLKKGEGLQESFAEWLFGYFGHKSVMKEEKCTETLRFPLFNKIYTLDPAHTFFAADYNMIIQIFDTLVRFDNKTGQIEPHLAHFWEVNEDHTLWTFYLRKGVLFHHGREMTAHDVKYTFLRLLEPELDSGNAWLAANIEDIEVWDSNTFRIRLKRSNVLFLRLLSFAAVSIVPEDIYTDNRDLFSRMPIGTGPFRIERNDGYICRLKVFDSYFGIRPHLDQVEIWFLPEELKETNRHFEWGQVITEYIGTPIPIGQSPKLSIEWCQIEKMISGSSLLSFNLNRQGPQQHPNFRQAVDLVIDREQMVRHLGGNRAAPSSGFLPAIVQEDIIAPLDLSLAKKLLIEMGYESEPLVLYSCSCNPDKCEDSLWIKNQCAKVGIPIEIVVVNKIDMIRLDKILEPDMILSSVVVETDHDLFIIQMLLQSNSCIRAHLRDDLTRYKENMITDIFADESEHGRSSKISDLLAKLRQERSFLFILHHSFQISYHSSVKGVTMNELGWVDFRNIWFAPNSLINADKMGNTL